MATYASTHVIDEIRLGNWKRKAECRSRSRGCIDKEIKKQNCPKLKFEVGN
jgi:hypothetical protein